MLPLLLSRLDSQDVVVYTYAAVALDRILSMRVRDSAILMYVSRVKLTPLFTMPVQVFVYRRSTLRPSTLKRPLYQDRSTTEPRASSRERFSYALCVHDLIPLMTRASVFALMGGIARVIITAKQGLGEGYANVLQRLVSILRVIARNPSNPNFDQYIFESISGLILRVPCPSMAFKY